MPRLRYRFLLAILALTLPNRSEAAPPLREFRIDASHSDVAFSIGFLRFPVRGRFDDIRGTITYVEGNPTASSFSVVLGAKSIQTGSAHRDEHLRSSDFFDVEQYPNIVFQSRAGKRSGDHLVLSGPLTMHGVTRDVQIPFREVASPVRDHAMTLVLFSGTTRLNRKDFQIMGGDKFNPWFDEVRSAAMAESVYVTLDVQGWATDYDRDERFRASLAKVKSQGIDSVLAGYRALLARDPGSVQGAEWQLEELGRALMQQASVSDAVKLQRFTTEIFPKSAAAHAELARGFEVRGDKAAARASVQRALELDPYETHAMEIAKRLD